MSQVADTRVGLIAGLLLAVFFSVTCNFYQWVLRPQTDTPTIKESLTVQPAPVEAENATTPNLPVIPDSCVTRAEFDALKAEVAELRGALKTLANEPRIFNITQPVKEREVAKWQPLHLHMPQQEKPVVHTHNYIDPDHVEAWRDAGDLLDKPKDPPEPAKVQTVEYDGKTVTTTSGGE